MIKVLIADDHAVVRAGLKQIISEIPGMYVAAEATNGIEALTKFREADFDIVILDLTMPRLGGLDVLKQVKIYNPNIPVLVLSIHSEKYYAKRVLKAGAAGFLTKESAPDELIKAIKRISGGRKYVSDSLAEVLAQDLGVEQEKAPHEYLSDREFQVMLKLANGRRVIEIASDLSLSIKTISTYRSRILEKMRMETNADLTRYALNNQLLD